MPKYKKLSRPSEEANRLISESIAKRVASLFPVDGNFFRLDVSNIEVEFGSSGINSVKKALVSGSSINNRVKATVTLFDKQSHKKIDTKRRVIMTIPSFTKKGSFVIEGNSYVIPFQQRLRAGVYTMKKRNGAIETMFNLGKGRNFTIKLTGETFAVKVGSAHVSLYSILHFVGVSDSRMRKVWGDDMFEANKKTYKTSDAEKFMQLFSYDNAKTGENIFSDVKNAIESSTVSAPVVKHTLGIDSGTVDGEMMLKASSKLVKVFNGDKKPDDRENMMFKQVVTPEHMLSEAFDKSAREVVSKIRFKLSSPATTTVDDALGAGGVLLGRPIKTFVVSSKASLMPEEYNPMMMHMANHLITPLGEGGVGDTRALNLDTKAVHASHLGFIDPVVSPEGASVGITLAITENAYVDEDGIPAMKVVNARSGEEEVVPLDVLWKSKLSYPTSKERIKSDGIMVRVGERDVLAKSTKDIDYIMPKTLDMHAPSSNLVPVANSADANRFNMAQKHIQQALSLTAREAPHVSVGTGDGQDYAAKVAVDSGHIPSTRNGGVVIAIKPDHIIVQAKDGTKEKIEYVKDMPLARKTFINHELTVKVGDKLKPGQHIADSNFTKDGNMALGKNIRTAWLSMRGNRNDGVVISETAAEMFTSEHMYKENIDVDPTDIQDFKRFLQLFPREVSKWGADNYDARGVIRKGKILKHHQPMAFIIKKADAKQLKSKLEKVMFSPYKAKIITWHHADEGEVIEANTMGSEIRLNIKVKSPMKVGDKMSGRFGNKGVITRIDPDEHMPRDKDGNIVHVTMTAAGVISRTNGGSLIEAGLGKIVEKTGKRYILPHYEKEDNLKFMEDEAKKHGVELYEELINPKTGKPFPGKIFVGNPSMMKLFKDGESGMSAVGVGATDINGQPVKGGSESASSFSNMEANALLAYGANSLLSEAKHIKSQKNDEFFDAFRRGVPTPPPAENFASAKFKSYLEQMAVDVVVNKHTGEYSMIPMDDKEIVKRSSGKVKNADTIYAKNGKPVKGGLFDEVIFGGPSGSRSSHIDLGTKILNPMYKDHVSRMLGVSNADLLSDIETNGIDSVIKKISKIDPKKEIKRLKSEILSSSNSQVANRNIKTIKMLDKTMGIKKKPKDVMFLSKVPVVAPIYRPASKDSNGDISINDLNLHYQDVFAMADAITHSGSLNKKTALSLKSDLYKSVGALYGTEESPNKKIRDKKIKGVLDILGGDQPKNSYAQQNLLRIKQFMSGRAVIVPARSDISIDQIEIPEAMGLKMYEPHISRRMSRMGYSPMETKELIEAKDPKILSVMKDIGKQIPLAYNRAPTLWKHGILGGYPVFTKGSVIGVNPLTETALGSDYDGDQIGVHVPVGKAAIEDLKTKMMPSQNLFSDRLSHEAPSLLQLPDQDATLGIYKASIGKKGRNPIVISSVAKLKEKLRVGEIHYSDYVKVG